jgi:PPOX class probable F420-dependent enzyme
VLSVSTSPTNLTAAALEFLTERHLATLSTHRANGEVHVVPVGFTWDPQRSLARVITDASSRKARNAAEGKQVAICQVDGARWLTLEGHALVSAEPDDVAEAVERYERRYRQPRENPTRVAIEIAVTRVMGSAAFLTI